MPIWFLSLLAVILGALALAETSTFVNRGRYRQRADWNALATCWGAVGAVLVAVVVTS